MIKPNCRYFKSNSETLCRHISKIVFENIHICCQYLHHCSEPSKLQANCVSHSVNYSLLFERTRETLRINTPINLPPIFFYLHCYIPMYRAILFLVLSATRNIDFLYLTIAGNPQRTYFTLSALLCLLSNT